MYDESRPEGEHGETDDRPQDLVVTVSDEGRAAAQHRGRVGNQAREQLLDRDQHQEREGAEPEAGDDDAACLSKG
jgi:hypothetical protein